MATEQQFMTIPAEDYCPAIISGVNSIAFVTTPECYPIFMAWARKNGAIDDENIDRIDDEERRRMMIQEHIAHLLQMHGSADHVAAILGTFT